MDPVSILQQGRQILDAVLTPYGFTFEAGATGKGSGGPSASASYTRGPRRLELHFRWSLGLVTYHFGKRALSHEEYMWSVLGRSGGNQYPGFSSDPLKGFEHLAYDLQHHARDFLAASDEELTRRFEGAAARPKPRGLKAISDERGAV